VSETHATAPVFPPGRYGRRRDGRRRVLGPAIILAVVLVACLALTWALYRKWGDPHYDAQIVGWNPVSNTRLTIEFKVTVPAGGAATCGLRARDYGGNEVGFRQVTVQAAAGQTEVDVHEVITTSARASVGDVTRCAPA
jgi:hypothetical protein